MTILGMMLLTILGSAGISDQCTSKSDCPPGRDKSVQTQRREPQTVKLRAKPAEPRPRPVAVRPLDYGLVSFDHDLCMQREVCAAGSECRVEMVCE